MSYSAEVLADTPLAYWRLGETTGTTAADSAGNGRSGTYTASPTLGSTSLLVGDTDPSMTTIANTGSRVVVPNAAWMNVTAMSIEALVAFTAGADVSNGDAIVSRYATGAFQFLLWRNTNNRMAIQFVNTAVTVFNVFDTASVVQNATYHVVATLDGTTCRLYVNGVPIGSTAAFTGTLGPVGSQNLEIGRNSNANATTPAALIDEVAFYDYALSATRVAAHYAAATGTTASSTAALSLTASGGSGGASPGGSSGSASLSLSASGAAGGPSGAAGAASLSLTASGSAGGSSSTTGTASLSLTASASSTSPASGTAILTLTASESAPNAAGGTATLTLSAGGVAVALFTTDLSNAFDGLDLVCMATVTLTRPPAPVPPTLVQAVRYEKAVPYRAPVMVGGRPT